MLNTLKDLLTKREYVLSEAEIDDEIISDEYEEELSEDTLSETEEISEELVNEHEFDNIPEDDANISNYDLDELLESVMMAEEGCSNPPCNNEGEEPEIEDNGEDDDDYETFDESEVFFVEDMDFLMGLNEAEEEPSDGLAVGGEKDPSVKESEEEGIEEDDKEEPISESFFFDILDI